MAILAALALAAQGATSCPPRDKECLFKRIKANPVLASSYWTAPLAKPLLERIGTATPEVVEYLQLDVALNDLPNKPRAAAADSAFIADVRRAFEGIPAPIRKLLERKLGGILFAEDIGGTGFAEATEDRKVGFIVLDRTVLARQTANAWASWKDNTPFRPDPAWRLETRIAASADDNRMRAIQYILLHEIGHVLSIGAGVHPPWNRPPKGVDTSKLYFFGLSWKVDGERYVSRFDADFPKRRDVRFYFGAKLDGVDMLPVYESLEKTSFPTLYAATHPADDFAESFASSVHVVMMGRDHEVRLYRQGRLVKTIGPCWGQARCAYKRTALETALGLPVTR
ncbi:MAG TPA: hypothetical protein VFV90_08195 [Usitatibacter sp.]|nr:hypothetical protein [Usitatibacter sp.]